jgi:hypothetical protein
LKSGAAPVASDLPAFCAKIVELFADGTPSKRAEKTSASR